MHELYDIIDVKIIAPYTLWIKFDDATEQIIDFRPLLRGELYSPLKNIELFNQVMIDPETRILIWPNGADFDPETLHNWQDYRIAFEQQAASWIG